MTHPLPRPEVRPTCWPSVVVTLVLTLILGACATSTVPETANGIIDLLEDDAVITCRERREPVPDVVTCEDDEAGDITVGITDTPLVTIAATSSNVDGPWIAGDTFVVITYDDDADRVRSLRDSLGEGDLYTVDEDGQPIALSDS